MERVWIVLRMGGGEGLHHGEDEQAGHVQVNIELNNIASSNGKLKWQARMARSNQVDLHILS